MIKLLNRGTIDGVTRLQSQLRIGKDTCDFILEDGILKNFGEGERGFNFYPCNLEYEIIDKVNWLNQNDTQIKYKAVIFNK
jgi:hypothetical protein